MSAVQHAWFCGFQSLFASTHTAESLSHAFSKNVDLGQITARWTFHSWSPQRMVRSEYLEFIQNLSKRQHQVRGIWEEEVNRTRQCSRWARYELHPWWWEEMKIQLEAQVSDGCVWDWDFCWLSIEAVDWDGGTCVGPSVGGEKKSNVNALYSRIFSHKCRMLAS